MQPLKATYSDLVKPFLPSQGDHNNHFLKAIEEVSKPGTRARFWRKREGREQKGGWIVPGYSGTVVEDDSMRRLAIIDPNQKWLVRTSDKVIKEGIDIVVLKEGDSWGQVTVTSIVYKKMDLGQDNNAETVDWVLSRTQDIIEEHIRYASEHPQGIATPPLFLGKVEKAGKRSPYIDFEEKRVIGHLSQKTLLNPLIVQERKIPFTFKDLATGFKHVAEALLYIKSEGRIHSDVKPSNIFIEYDGKNFRLGLSDFELLIETWTFFSPTKHSYCYWDELRASFGTATAFCDVYGFAQSLAEVLWGEPFLDMAHSEDIALIDNVFKVWEKAYQDKSGAVYGLHVKAFEFSRRVKIQNNERAARLRDAPQAYFTDYRVRGKWLNEIEVGNIQMEECLEFAESLEKLFEVQDGAS